MALKLKRKRDEDLFQESTMTFGEHLEELRRALFLALVWLVGGFIIGLLIGEYVVMGIQTPLKASLERYYKQDSKDHYNKLLQEYRDKGLPLPHDPDYVENMVTEEGMLFEPVFIEADEVIDGLTQSFPNELAGVKLPANPPEHELSMYGPTRVFKSDLTDVPKLCERLSRSSAAAKPDPARRFWDRLSKTDQAKVEKLGLATGVSDDDKVAVATMLDGLLDKTDLYDPAQFEGVRLTAEGEALRKRTGLSAPEQRRFNRLLLEAVFTGSVAATHPEMLPLMLWRRIADDQRTRIQSLTPGEVFGFYIQASLIVGLIIGSPGIFYHLWSFVASGLYPHEKRYVHIFLPFSIVLFLSGAGLAFFFVFQRVLDFLFSYNKSMGIDPDPRIGEWMGFVLLMPIAFGLSFQLPLVMLFLERIGIMTVQSYLSKWRIAVLVIFVAAMVLTPSVDPVSMLLMALPLTFLYFGSIALCKWLPKSRSPYED